MSTAARAYGMAARQRGVRVRRQGSMGRAPTFCLLQLFDVGVQRGKGLGLVVRTRKVLALAEELLAQVLLTGLDLKPKGHAARGENGRARARLGTCAGAGGCAGDPGARWGRQWGGLKARGLTLLCRNGRSFSARSACESLERA